MIGPPPSRAKRLPLLVRLRFSHIRDPIETIKEVESWRVAETIANAQKRMTGTWTGICVSVVCPWRIPA
jgi:hypothetical protein